MKILLTGSSGQLGRALHPGLELFGDLTAISRVDLDLNGVSKLRDLLAHVCPDLIVNAAAYTDVDGAEGNRNIAFRLNSDVPATLAEWAANNGCSLVHYSTDYVFPGSGSLRWSETDQTAPVNTYGESKLAGDEAVLASQAPALILRTSWVYATTGRNFLKTMLRLGRKHDKLSVVADQVGAPTPASVLAEITLEVIGQGRGQVTKFFERNGGVINATTMGSTSWHGFAEAIFELARQRDIPLKIARVHPILSSEYSASATRPLNSRLDLGFLLKRFGIRPPHWRDALERVMDQLTE